MLFAKSLSENSERCCGGSFDRGLHGLVRHRPLRGCSGLAALAITKIHRCRIFQNFQTGSHPRRPHSGAAFTLVELSIAIAIGSMVAIALCATLLYGVRSTAALNNYTALNRDGRRALDTLMADIRSFRVVTNATPSATYSNLSSVTFVDLDDVSTTYEFHSATRTLVRTVDSGSPMILVTNCTGAFDLFQHTLKSNSWEQYENPATFNECKVVQVRWSAVRTLVGRTNSEDIVTAKILMRN